MKDIKSSILLAICFLAFSAAGFYAGNIYSQHKYAAVFETNIARDAALQIPVLTHALEKIKSGDIEAATVTLEGALKTQTILLDSCTEESCKALKTKNINQAKSLLNSDK